MVKTTIHRCFLEKCKYVVKENEVNRFINDDIEITSDDSDKGSSDESGKEYIKIKYHNSVFLEKQIFI